MPKLPIDLHSNENFSYLFICPTGAANTQTTSFRPRCLLYPKPKFNAKRTTLRRHMLNYTNKNKEKQQT